MSASPFNPLRVTILLGYRLEDPLPEAVELAKAAALDFQRSGLAVEIRVDVATAKNLQREASGGCDLFVFYGHGSEDGRLTFADDHFGFADLTATAELARFWNSLAGCFVFACYGDRFAASLPGPWVAFRDPILKTAPKGFVHAFVEALGDRDLAAAIAAARERCRHEMESPFVDVFEISKAPWWNRGVAAGVPRISRGSPALTGLHDADFGSVELDGHLYPDHDPFVGRIEDLRSLLKIPSGYGDRRLQRAVWVHGDPGMGKSALLRELATLVRDTVFRDEGEPVHLLQRYCFNFTRPEQLVEAVCAGGAKLYRLAEQPASIEDLLRSIEGRTGTHVWLLDDLTYLAIRPDQQVEALRVARAILSAARVHAIPLFLLVSSRRRPVWEHEALEVGALEPREAMSLAVRVLRREPGAGPTPLDVAHLFEVVGRSTATFKRSLLLAAAHGITAGEYADLLRERDGLAVGEQREPALRALRYEREALGTLEPAHGFAYRSFLAVLYRLVKRAAHFTVAELVAWFREDLLVPSSARAVASAYRDGLAYLARLGFLTVGPGAERSFTLPPNQRWSVRSLEDHSVALPSSVPLRGVSARLSLAIERAAIGDSSAVGELLAMEGDYLADLMEPQAARAIFYSRLLRAELVPGEAGLPFLDEIISAWDLHAGVLAGSEAEEPVAKALVNKGVRLVDLGRVGEALSTYEEVVRRFGDRAVVAVAVQVAIALLNKAIALTRSGDVSHAVVALDEVVRRFLVREEVAVMEVVARALLNKGALLAHSGLRSEAISMFESVVERFGTQTETSIVVWVCRAIYNKAVSLSDVGDHAGAVSVYDELLRRFGDRVETPIAQALAEALFNKATGLDALAREEEELAVYDEIVSRFGDRTEVFLAVQAAKALNNKRAVLARLRRVPEAVAALIEVVERYGDRQEAEIASVVGVAVERLEMLSEGLSAGAEDR